MSRTGAVILGAGVCLAMSWTLLGGQPAEPKQSGPPAIQAARCRMTLFKDQPVAAGRMGVLEFVGRKVETGKNEKGEPVYKVVELTEGMEVKEGEVIAQLVDDVAEAALRVAETEAESDIEIRYQEKATELAFATHEAAILANRRLPNTFPAIEIKKLYLDFEKGGLAKEQAEHQRSVVKMKVQEAAATLDTYRIRAPFDGVITYKLKSKGEAVREGDPIVEMANTNRVRVEGHVKPLQGRQLKRGMKVLVQQENDDRGLESQTFEGTILLVDVQLDKVLQHQRVVVEVINTDGGLVAGRLATMSFVTDSAGSK